MRCTWLVDRRRGFIALKLLSRHHVGRNFFSPFSNHTAIDVWEFRVCLFWFLFLFWQLICSNWCFRIFLDFGWCLDDTETLGHLTGHDLEYSGIISTLGKVNNGCKKIHLEIPLSPLIDSWYKISFFIPHTFVIFPLSISSLIIAWINDWFLFCFLF